MQSRTAAVVHCEYIVVGITAIGCVSFPSFTVQFTAICGSRSLQCPRWSNFFYCSKSCSVKKCLNFLVFELTLALFGGFQLEFVSISRVISHMICYKFECSHWLKLQYSEWRANLYKGFFLNKFSTNESTQIYNRSCDTENHLGHHLLC